MKTVWIVVPDRAMASSVAISLDVLRAAQSIAGQSASATSKAGAAFDVKVVASRRRATTGVGLAVAADMSFREAAAAPAKPSWVIVPAMGEYGDRLFAHLAAPDALAAQRLLRSLRDARVPIAASCASVFLLAEAGIADGHTVTSTWWLAGAFRERYPAVTLDEARMVVRDGRLLTSGSAFSHLDLMLAVLSDLVGVRVAELCARYLLIDRRPSQARYMMATHALHRDPLVVQAERWIDEHLAASPGVAALAQQLALSEKSLSRRVQAATGLSPIRLIQRRRLLMATHLIETTRLPIEEVAARVGYRDSTTLRRLMRRELETNPSALR